MKLILREDVANLGHSGEVVEVKDGYGRNFLIPKKLAVAATRKNLGRLEHEKRVIGDAQKQKLTKAQKQSEELAAHSLTILCQVGEQDKLFGAVTNKDIAEALRRDGFNLDRRQIALEEPLKQLGVYTVAVKLGEGVEAKLKVWLVAK
jgi:large subunit ribosomal protein L9